MTTKHTPGPWHVTTSPRSGKGHGKAIVVHPHCQAKRDSVFGYVVAEIDGQYQDTREATPEARANAQLIAAAPDLLEALQWIIEFVQERPIWFNGPFDDSPENLWLQNAKEAIAKALGK